MKNLFREFGAVVIAAALSLVSTATVAATYVISTMASAAKGLAEKAHDLFFDHLVRHGLVLAMTTLAANKVRSYELGDGQEYPVVATDIIYEGAAVGENGSGYARPLVAGDPFLGFALRKADNAAGAAGDVRVEVRRRGEIQVAVVGATTIVANDHPLVYAADDDTFTLTAGSNTIIGRVARWVSSGVCVVEFDVMLATAEAARVAGDA